jgi:sec-independent protein translocase protein TatC
MAEIVPLPEADERRMSVLEHLEELRRVLIISLSAWAAATVVGWFLSAWVLHLLLIPARQVVGNRPIVYFKPTGAFLINLKIALAVGFAIALPIVLWQIWTFIAPGLRPAERRFAGPFIASALVLFVVGATFAYIIMPIALRFLTGIDQAEITYTPQAELYLSLILVLIMVFGVTFEFPVALILLAAIGLVRYNFLKRRRIPFWIGIVVVSLLVTPGADPFTPMLLALPLIVMFEISVLIIRRMQRSTA